MPLGFSFSTLFVALAAVLVGNGLVLVDISPLSRSLGSLLPATPRTTAEGKPLVVKNEDVRRWLETRSGKGPMVKHPQYKSFPIKGVYMFHRLGTAALVDFSYLENWNVEAGQFDLNMSYCFFQTGMPPLEYGYWGYYVPGAIMTRVLPAIGNRNRFTCPKVLKDGDSCVLTDSIFGRPFEEDLIRKVGMRWFMVKEDGGRKYVRPNYFAPPWHDSNDVAYWKSRTPFHSYDLLRVVDEDGNIDEENYQHLIRKLDGSDLASALESMVF